MICWRPHYLEFFSCVTNTKHNQKDINLWTQFAVSNQISNGMLRWVNTAMMVTVSLWSSTKISWNTLVPKISQLHSQRSAKLVDQICWSGTTTTSPGKGHVWTWPTVTWFGYPLNRICAGTFRDERSLHSMTDLRPAEAHQYSLMN